MSFLWKPDPKEEKSQLLNFFNSSRWWFNLCSIIGLPLGKMSYNIFVQLYVLILLLCNIATGLMIVAGLTIMDFQKYSASYVFQISSHLNHFAYLISNTLLHAIVVWKLKEFRGLMQTIHQQVTIDTRLQKWQQMSITFVTIWIITTQMLRIANFISNTTPLFIYSGALHTTAGVLWVVSEMYPDVVSYTFTLLTTTLAHQFSLLKAATLKAETLLQWEALQERQLQLCKLAKKLQSAFTLLLTLLTCGTLSSICFTVFYIAEAIAQRELPYMIFSKFTFLAVYSLRCFSICSAADSLTNHANSMALDLAEADVKYHRSPEIQKIIRRISCNVRRLGHLTCFSLGGFCQLGKPLLPTMLAVVITYFVLLRQMRNDEMNPSSNYTNIYQN